MGPAEFAKLGGVDGVAVVIERTIVCVLNPLAEVVGVKSGGGGKVEEGEEFGAELKVGDFVSGTDVVDLVDVTDVEDGVEGVDGVGGVEVAAGGFAGAVEDEGAVAMEEAGEFGDDFCGQ